MTSVSTEEERYDEFVCEGARDMQYLLESFESVDEEVFFLERTAAILEDIVE